jgi:hypothetical protein
VEWCGVPRFVFSDFPLGNPTGRPFDVSSQHAALELGFRLLEEATAPGTTVVNPEAWSADASWKQRVFTKAQPFLTEDATAKWIQRKAAYKTLRAAGKV